MYLDGFKGGFKPSYIFFPLIHTFCQHLDSSTALPFFSSFYIYILSLSFSPFCVHLERLSSPLFLNQPVYFPSSQLGSIAKPTTSS